MAVTSRSDVGTRLSDLYPRHRVPPDARGARRRAPRPGRRRDRRLPARRRRAGGGRAARARRARGRPRRPTSACASLDIYEQWYGAHPRARAARRRRLRAAPSCTATQIAGADIVANPGCFPTAALLALAPLARAGSIADVVIDAKTGRVGRRARADGTTHFVDRPTRTSTPTASPATATRPRSTRSSASLGAPIRATTFVPHLVPLDQGELVSCYVTPARAGRRRRAGALFAAAYADEPFVELADRRPGVRDVRDTNFCRIPPRRRAHAARSSCFAAIDNLWKGAASQAVQNLNLMFGVPEETVEGLRERLLRTRAGSRLPALGARGRPRAGLPAGFRAAGVAAGIKPSGGTDVGLLVCDAPETTSAARFTRSGVLAAPVLVTRERCAPGRAARGGGQLGQRQRRHGRARAGRRGQDAGRGGDGRRGAGRSGRRGLDRRDRRAARRARGASAAWPAPAPSCAATATATSRGDQTTDAFEKRASLEVELSGGTVRLCAQAKGAGMISPRFATMLCFVQTDAALEAETADLLLGRVREALVRSHLGRRPALDQRHRDPHVLGRQRRARRARVRGRAALRPGARRAAAPARAGHRARRRGRQADRPRRRARRPRRQRRGGRARGGQLAAGQGGAARRRPQLGADRAGGGDGAARRRRRWRSTSAIEGVQVCAGGGAIALRRQGAGAGRARATRSSTSSSCRATATRPRSSSPISATST